MTWLGRDVRTRPLRGVVAVASTLVLGAVWWWAALRLVFVPSGAGVVEGTVVAGGWGLSLLPVHCVPWAQAVGARRQAQQEAMRRRMERAHRRAGERQLRAGVTGGVRRRRSGGGSGRS